MKKIEGINSILKKYTQGLLPQKKKQSNGGQKKKNLWIQRNRRPKKQGTASKGQTPTVRQRKISQMSHTQRLMRRLSNSIGIDFGTVNTVGVLYDDAPRAFHNQSSLVALNTHTNRIESIGNTARAMFGRTPAHIKIIQPVQEGVIADFEIAEQVISFLLKKAERKLYRPVGPTVVLGVPPSATDADIQTFKRITKQAGARDAYVVYEPFAALVSLIDDFDDGQTSLVIDIGGGTTDILVFSQNNLVTYKSIPIAGCLIDSYISDGLKEDKGVEVGFRTAEDIKTSALSRGVEKGKKFLVRGRAAASGLPVEVILRQEQIDVYSRKVRGEIVRFVRDTVESLDPDLSVDLMEKGVFLSGGGSNLFNIQSDIEKALDLPVTIVTDPFETVARGGAIIARNPTLFSKFFI